MILRLVGVSIALLIAVCCSAKAAHAEDEAERVIANPVAVKIADLKDRLEKGLRANQPEHFAFVERVVELVEKDVMPLPIVNACYKWSRKRKPYNPFPYFEKAMRILSEREGVEL